MGAISALGRNESMRGRAPEYGGRLIAVDHDSRSLWSYTLVDAPAFDDTAVHSIPTSLTTVLDPIGDKIAPSVSRVVPYGGSGSNTCSIAFAASFRN
jgi:hypothetical protein